jgi:hypothetical protein
MASFRFVAVTGVIAMVLLRDTYDSDATLVLVTYMYTPTK